MHGKTYLAIDLLNSWQEYCQDVEVPAILWCYSFNKPDALKQQAFLYKGVPSVSEIIHLASRSKKLTLVFDDLLQELMTLDKKARAELLGFITNEARKLRVNFYYLSQVIYNSELYFHRLFLSCCNYLILFDFPADQQALNRLATQLWGSERRRHFLRAYRAAVKRPHGYLFVKLRRSNTQEEDPRGFLRNFVAARTSQPSSHSAVFREKDNILYTDH